MSAPVPWGLPRDASVHGWRVDWLMGTTTLFVALMFTVTLVWILWACFLHGPRHAARYDLGSARGTVIKALAVSLAVFLVVDGNLLLHGTQDIDQVFWRFDQSETDPNVVRIEINAHQWAWDVRYAGPDGLFATADDVVALNEVKIPIGRPVVFQLAATDVIHSFSLPNFRTKQDAIPGTITRLRIEAKTPGRYDIACAQHCGVHHYKMRGTLSVLTGQEYDRWLHEAAALSARAFDPDDRGAHWGWAWQTGHDRGTATGIRTTAMAEPRAAARVTP